MLGSLEGYSVRTTITYSWKWWGEFSSLLSKSHSGDQLLVFWPVPVFECESTFSELRSHPSVVAPEIIILIYRIFKHIVLFPVIELTLLSVFHTQKRATLFPEVNNKYFQHTSIAYEAVAVVNSMLRHIHASVHYECVCTCVGKYSQTWIRSLYLATSLEDNCSSKL